MHETENEPPCRYLFGVLPVSFTPAGTISAPPFLPAVSPPQRGQPTQGELCRADVLALDEEAEKRAARRQEDHRHQQDGAAVEQAAEEKHLQEGQLAHLVPARGASGAEPALG